MDKIVYNLVYNRKGSLNKKGTALVQIEAYQGKRKKYFSTKVYLKPEQWDNKKLIVKIILTVKRSTGGCMSVLPISKGGVGTLATRKTDFVGTN